MRGLSMFINDLRNCKGKDEESKRINEELANIRNKLNGNKPLNGYQKRKYVCKLVFIFLLGYKCDLGMVEAVNLLSSKSYCEKQAGYLFISVIKGESSNLMQLVTSAVKADLLSTQAVFQNMALQFLANSTSLRLADSLVDKVVKMLLSTKTPCFVKQSAILALLQIFRIKSDLVLPEYKINYLMNMVSHDDLGLATASASLIEFLIKNSSFKNESCMEQCIIRLSQIVSCSFNEFRDYMHYSILAPWMCIKLLRILQNFSAPSDASLKSRLNSALEIIFGRVYDNPSNVKKFEYNNVKYAIVFEAISLVVHMNIGDPLLHRAFIILEITLESKVINFRFMALEIMNQLSKNRVYLEHLKPQWRTILNLLKTESDITMKKQTVDLLYTISSDRSVKPIVDELLNFLENEDDFKEEVILKTAALAEQLGTDSEWYFDKMLYLFQVCGEKVSESMWHSLIKIVIENDSIQEHAAKMSYAALCENSCCDAIIKLAGYILGEVGYLIASDPQSSCKLQLNAIKEKYSKCSTSTKALLLTTFMKFYNIYPDMKDEIQLILNDARNIKNENEEIQQRSVEYLKLIETASRDLLAIVFERMPSKLQKASGTITAIEKKDYHKVSEHQTEINSRKKYLTASHSHDNLNNVVDTPDAIASRRIKSVEHFHSTNSSSNMNLLVDVSEDTLNINAGTVTLPETSVSPVQIANILNNQPFLYNLLFNEKAELYENNSIVILIKCDFNKHFGIFHLKYINMTGNDLTKFTIQGNFSCMKDKCFVQFTPCDSELPAYGHIKQSIHLECLSVFSERPSLTLKFTCKNQENEVVLIMPLTLNKFVQPEHMTPDAFIQNWENFESGEEVIKEFAAKYPMIYGVTLEKLKGFRLAVIENVNSDSENFHCSGIFYTQENQIFFLVLLERYILKNKYCCRVRSSQHSLSQVISDLLCELL